MKHIAWLLCWGLLGQWAGAAGSEEDFFSGQGQLSHLDIQLTTENQLKLFHDHRTYVPATVSEGETVYEEVALRLKGNEDGSFRGLHDKPAMTLNFDRIKEDQLFHGMDKLYLNNSVEDPSLMAEIIATDLFVAAGIPAPRVTHVRVSLNGRALGVYVFKEGFNKRFLRRHFRSPDGNFYDGGLVNDVDEELEKSSGKGPDDRSDLLGLAAAAREQNPTRRWESLAEWVDLDAFIRFMAMEVISGHYDGYCMNRNNYRVYRDPASDRFVFLPTGMDIMFSDPDNDIEPYMDGLIARAVIETEQGRAGFYRSVAELFQRCFDLPAILVRIDQLDQRVRPALAPLGPAVVQEYVDGLQNLRGRVQLRHDSVAACVAAPLAQAPAFPVDLPRGVADGWRPCDEEGDSQLQQSNSPDGVSSLFIGTAERGMVSWRRALWLKPGRYRFDGRIRTKGILGWDLPFGRGAGLRVTGLGRAKRPGLVGTEDWQPLQYEFVVEPGPEPVEVELVCELVAQTGEVWFDTESLRLERIGE